jgi:hypothetical protein
MKAARSRHAVSRDWVSRLYWPRSCTTEVGGVEDGGDGERERRNDCETELSVIVGGRAVNDSGY